MELQTVRIDSLASGAYRCEIESLFSLAYEVFHASAIAVICDNLIDLQLHVRDDKRKQMRHLVSGFLLKMTRRGARHEAA